MTLQEFIKKLEGGERWDIGVAINRSNSIPLDASTVFTSKKALEDYASGNPPKGYLANAYPGQIVSVINEDEAIVYYIDNTFTPQEVGIKLSGDDATIDVENKTIVLKGFADAGLNTVLTKDGNGNLTWKSLDSATPIKGVADNDPVLSVSDQKIKSDIKIEYNDNDGLIELKGNGKTISTITVSDLFGDGLIEDVEYDEENDALIFSWKTSAGVKSSSVQLTNLLDPYIAGNGVDIDSNLISIKVSTQTEQYLVADETGLRIVGVDSKIKECTDRLDKLEKVDPNKIVSDALVNYYDKTSVEGALFTIEDGYRIIDGGRLTT